MDKPFSLPVGGSALDQQLEFRANSVQVDNPTNQWLLLPSLGVTIPQYTIGATYPLPGTTRAQASFTAPAGQENPPIIAEQVATVTFYDLALPSTAGVGMLGGRAPYYDRNPVLKPLLYGANGVAPHGVTVRAAYTVPSGKKGYLQSAHALLNRATAAAPVGVAGTLVRVGPAAGGSVFVASVQSRGNVADNGRIADVGNIGLLVAGDLVECQTYDLSTGGTIDYEVSALVSEFDA